MSDADDALAVRRGAGLFAMETRGLLEITGGDRVRWLNGMVSNDVEALEPGPARSGCYATLLSRKGRIVTDLHVLLRPEAYWLELSRDVVSEITSTLEKFIVADDVELADRSADTDRLGLEGPAARAILAAAADAPAACPDLAPAACADLRIGGVDAVVAAFGWSGETAYQILAPTGGGDAVAACLEEAAEPGVLRRTSEAVLEILRVEAGIPRLGAELSDDVLPDEARLEAAISTTKGCYTGQEIVARLRSRGQVNHLLVGLRFPDGSPAPVGTALEIGGRRSGEVTSSCMSPGAGAIGLGFVRRAHAEAGTELAAEGRVVRVTAVPFAGPGARPGGAGPPA